MFNVIKYQNKLLAMIISYYFVLMINDNLCFILVYLPTLSRKTGLLYKSFDYTQQYRNPRIITEYKSYTYIVLNSFLYNTCVSYNYALHWQTC